MVEKFKTLIRITNLRFVLVIDFRFSMMGSLDEEKGQGEEKLQL